MEVFIFILEIIGTVAFAISGATVGIRKQMDLFGVLCLGLTTACGGGLVRDVILGKLPVMFTKSVYALTAIGVSLLVFIIVARHVKAGGRFYETFLLLADSLGLGIFTVVGMSASYVAGYGDRIFPTVFLGVITGVGGGLLRDVMAQDAPYIFVKHIYATASIIGAFVCYFANILFGEKAGMLCGLIVIVITRLLAARFHWSLPKIKQDE